MWEYRGIIGVLIIVFFTSNLLLAREVILLTNQTERTEAFDPQISVFEDRTGQVRFEKIATFNFDSTSIIFANNRDEKTAYWIKFEVEAAEDITKNKIFEILDFKIDSFELYLPNLEGHYVCYKGGDAYVFSSRQYKHKNFVFDFPHYKKGKYTGFIRIKSNEVVGLNFAISNISSFNEYSNKEYLILSLFYGVIVALALLSICMYVYLYEKSYLFYSLYILSLGLYFLTRDGLGFQFLWPEAPEVNVFCKSASVLMVVLFHVFFARFYLNLGENSRIFNKIMYSLLVAYPLLAYTADNFLGILPDPLMAVSFIFVPLLFFSIRLALKGDIQARFFVLAYSVQFFGFLVFGLAYLDWIGKGSLIFYSINIASGIEIIIFSLALAGKVKQLIKEKEEIKDLANKVLEQKVIERTKELKERNEQLDVFVYKASHDIKGPLKSMIGLTKLALEDVKDLKAKEYFEYMLSTSFRLDRMVSDLLKMGQVKDLEVKYSEVNLCKVIQEIISSLRHLPKFDRIIIDSGVPSDYLFKTDEILIYSVFQNIIENAIKYMDDSKVESFLKIRFEKEPFYIHLFFEDNGLGIPKDRKERIFEMFYKVNNNSSGTGLGLYLTKLTVEKLGGKIELNSEEQKGTIFKISLPVL